MSNAPILLDDSTDAEKGAYICAIASLATADRQASEEEITYLTAIADAANLSKEQTDTVIAAAQNPAPEQLQQSLDVLQNSELKYSFVADLIAFAKSDQDYSEQEQHHVQQMAQYLGVQPAQYEVLDTFVDKATSQSTSPEEVSSTNFLSSTGLQDKMKGLGINGGSLVKGLIAIAGPLILSKMLAGKGNNAGGGGLGGMLGGLLGGGALGGLLGGSSGGLGGMLGGNRHSNQPQSESGGIGGMLSGSGGGLGSLIGMLSGGRGMGSLSGLLGNILGGKK